MKIIADSGSTKTQWVLLEEGKENRFFFTVGLNPYFLDMDSISAIIQSCFLGVAVNQVNEVYFYGSGCALPDKCNQVHRALTKVFCDAKIVVYSDVLASAHALFAAHAGVACILGTGSNAGVYDGVQFSSKVKSLGYLLGDEGSGSYIGRQLLQSYLRKEMPLTLASLFEKEFDVNHVVVLDHLYKQASPNKYLASFAPFASKHTADPFIDVLIHEAFGDFIKYQLSTLPFDKSLKVGFVGSIAYYFQDILKEEIEKEGYRMGKVFKEPIYSLIELYSKSL